MWLLDFQLMFYVKQNSFDCWLLMLSREEQMFSNATFSITPDALINQMSVIKYTWDELL